RAPESGGAAGPRARESQAGGARAARAPPPRNGERCRSRDRPAGALVPRPGDTTRMKASLLCALAAGCAAGNPSSYFDNAGRTDVGPSGIRRIEVDTPIGTFHVWTKRVGHNPPS